MAEYIKPLPVPDADSKPFWEGAQKHVLLVQHCQDCHHSFLYPRIVCPRCLSRRVEWVTSSGKACLYTYTIVRQTTDPGFAKEVPYIYAIVQLEEGPRMISNVVQCPLDEVKVGMPLEVIFEDVTADITLPKFRPAAGDRE